MIKVEETNIKADYYNPDQLEFSDAENILYRERYDLSLFKRSLISLIDK